MTGFVDIASVLLITVGSFFFLAGTAGLLRFPDTLSRIHALTKADNLGLGFVTAGLLLRSAGVFDAAQLLLIWLLVLISSSTACYLIANTVVTSSERSEAGK